MLFLIASLEAVVLGICYGCLRAGDPRRDGGQWYWPTPRSAWHTKAWFGKTVLLPCLLAGASGCAGSITSRELVTADMMYRETVTRWGDDGADHGKLPTPRGMAEWGHTHAGQAETQRAGLTQLGKTIRRGFDWLGITSVVSTAATAVQGINSAAQAASVANTATRAGVVPVPAP